MQDNNAWHHDFYRGTFGHRLGIAHQIVGELRELGELHGVITLTDVALVVILKLSFWMSLTKKELT